MASHFLINKELLFAYFAGQTTVLQKQMIEKWVEEDSENEECFYAYLHEWETMHPQYKADTDAAIAKFNESLLRSPPSFNEELVAEQQIITPSRFGGWHRWVVAASVLFVLMLGTWLFRSPLLYKSYNTGNGEIRMVTLTDGTKVVLKANSLLQVPRFKFGEARRQVHLKGEAKFSVVHTLDNQKFVVFADPALRVEVLGTEFNLATRKGHTKVVLQKGKVKVQYQEAPALAAASLIMAPGDLVSVDEKQKKLLVKQVQHPENYSAWQNGRFVFDKTSLNEIKDILEANYELMVSLPGIEAADATVSGSFKASNADELLQALSEVLNMNVIRQNNQVKFTNRS